MRRFLLGGLIGLLICGCGRVRPEAIDGDGDDGDEADGGVDAAPPAEARVTLLSDGPQAPLHGVRVVFFAPDGSVADSTTTAEDGTASAVVASGSAVAAFIEHPTPGGGPGFREARAVLDVQPGDDIRLAGLWFPTGEPTAKMTIAIAGLANDASIAVYSPCGVFNGQSSAQLLFYPGCEPPTFSIVVLALGATGPIRALVVEDVELDDGGAREFPAASLVAATTDRIQLTELPPDLAAVAGAFSAGRKAGSTVATDLLPVEMRTNVEDVAMMSLASIDELDAALLDVVLTSQDTSFGSQKISSWRSPVGGDFALAIGELALPWVGPMLYDVDNRHASWPRVGGQAWDASYITLQWSQGAAGAVGASGIWKIVAPPGVDRVTLPPLPEVVSPWLPPDLVQASAFGLLMESSALDGWNAARQLGLDGGYDVFSRQAPDQATVRVSFSGSSQGPPR